MSGNKTEKPTAKKIKDAAQKGQSFKSKELVITCLLLVGMGYLLRFIDFSTLTDVWRLAIVNNFSQDFHSYGNVVVLAGLKILLPFIGLCVVAATLPTLLQTGFLLASKALKLNFSSLNPVNGFKKMFSLRTVKDAVKSILFLTGFCFAGVVFWHNEKAKLFSQINMPIGQLFHVWAGFLSSMVMTCLLFGMMVVVLDALAEYFLHIKDLKMDKQEVKREHKEQDGNPEIKSKRKQVHSELLSEQVKSDVKNSKVIIANPTHIAVGIYINAEMMNIPFISVMETNQRALAVRAYAEEVGVPVVENIALARHIFNTHKRYSFVGLDEIDDIFKILIWLEQVESAWMYENQPDDEATAAGSVVDKKESTAPVTSKTE
ncbi:EscU/YscU/HrcU family type III secretion system export apparatus switch protein [Serratia silvae]|uniref:EscU/YscU/HrcU family type III secretion system export apparatus switch protein n=1 Tax=Serratia silvae TaxID=2824122 RepID=A0ABT0KAM3_9GAMM|nr:EscU/YscU/HrcU family type III secretion system export apparatus switch protein [Serratia silvae]MCL1028789.1 EscU/YscU/HrcU family type III secretion system export apparatus switch protein [Serratia silvae]